MRVAALLLVFTTSCFGLLRANTLPPLTDDSEVDPGAVRAASELQVAFALRFVGSADGAPMLTLWLRNEGNHKIPIDVSRLRIEGHTDASVRVLQLVDPRGELEPLHVEPGVVGRERIRLADPGRDRGELRRICIDPSSMFSPPPPLTRVCFVPGAGSTWQVES